MSDYPMKPNNNNMNKNNPNLMTAQAVPVDQYGQPIQQQPPQQFVQPVAVDQFGNPLHTGTPPPMVVGVALNNGNIRRDAQGNALCNKCSAPYPLPNGATSWRCRHCHEFNNASIHGDECCTLL